MDVEKFVGNGSIGGYSPPLPIAKIPSVSTTDGSTNTWTVQSYRTQRFTNHHFKGEVDRLERIRSDLIRRNKHLKKLIISEKRKLGRSVMGRVLEHQRLHGEELQRQKCESQEREEKTTARVELAECTQKNAEFHKQHIIKVHEIAEKLRYQASMEHRKQVEEEDQLKKEMKELEKKSKDFQHELDEVNNEIKNHTHSKETKENKIQNLKETLSLTKNQTSQLILDHKTIAEHNTELEFQIAQVKKLISSIKDDIAVRKKRQAADASAHQELDKKLQSLATEVWAQQRKLVAAKGSSRSGVNLAKRKRKM